MRYFVLLAFVLSLVLTTINANAGVALEAKCYDQRGKLEDCTVQSMNEALNINFKSSKNASLNRNIPGSSVTRITSGEFSKQRTAEAILLSPLFLLSKRKYEAFSIEYRAGGKKDVITVAIKQKQAQMMRSMLESTTDKRIEKNNVDNSGVVK